MIKSTEREELKSSLHDRSCTEVLWEDKGIHIQIWISENYMKSGPKDNKSKIVLTVVRWHVFSWSLSGDSESKNLDKKGLEQAFSKDENWQHYITQHSYTTVYLSHSPFVSSCKQWHTEPRLQWSTTLPMRSSRHGKAWGTATGTVSSLGVLSCKTSKISS